eukprot:2613254-Alexandrium_andersonii.AAC.1
MDGSLVRRIEEDLEAASRFFRVDNPVAGAHPGRDVQGENISRGDAEVGARRPVAASARFGAQGVDVR